MSKDFFTIFKEFSNSETFVISKGLLEDYKSKAAQAERERIIRLIQANSSTIQDFHDSGWLVWSIEPLELIERISIEEEAE
jgi:hypothetical protein